MANVFISMITVVEFKVKQVFKTGQKWPETQLKADKSPCIYVCSLRNFTPIIFYQTFFDLLCVSQRLHTALENNNNHEGSLRKLYYIFNENQKD